MDAENILALFKANPKLAMAVADAYQGARPWEPATHFLGDKHGEPTGDNWNRRSIMDPNLFVARVDRLTKGPAAGRWSWWYTGKREPRLFYADAVDTPEEAMRLADAGLDSVGVATASP